MFGRDPLMEFPDRDSAGGLQESLSPLGEFLDVHSYVSLFVGDWPFAP
jgi:hypothetical protein